MKISILTLGCKVNQAESSLIEGSLKNNGHEIVDISEMPDICIINTCTVTSKSDYQSRQLIRRANRVGARVIVTGCYSELNKESVRAMKEVSEVIDNDNKINIINKLSAKHSDSTLNFSANRKSRFFIKIQDGCSYSCSYCAIPKARGLSRSVPAERLIQQINHAASVGYNEMVLTGIHLGTYGLDLEPKVKLSELLVTILNKTKIKRIRLSSLEVREINDEFLEVMNDSRVCKHLHVPLQSGDDKILKLMRRAHDSKEFCTKIEHIYSKIPEISIGTDIIVGFPGEGEIEFKNTYDLLENLPFSYLHIFPFSPRPGTLASTMPDNMPFSVKKQRVHILESLNKKKKDDYMQKQIGKKLDVLIETQNNDGVYSGTTGNYLKSIIFSSNNIPRGSIIYAQISAIVDGRLHGSLI